MLNPHTSKLIAAERRRDMLAGAQRHSLARQVPAQPRNAQQLTQRVRLSLRTIVRPRPAAYA